MDDTGLEIVKKTEGNKHNSNEGDAESDAVEDQLAQIIAIWSKLTEQEKLRLSEFMIQLHGISSR